MLHTRCTAGPPVVEIDLDIKPNLREIPPYSKT